METITDISIKRGRQSRWHEVNWNQPEFGKHVSDHMFICHYQNGAWQEPQIVPFREISLSPVALGLHYGQSVFEGMKAFRMQNGAVSIFRPDRHHERLNRSLERMCMPGIPRELFISALHALIALDEKWVPGNEGTALYIRPFVFATEARFGVKVSEEYNFIIVTGPVPTLYEKPIKVKLERQYIRAARGGTGYAKCAGNYGGAFYPTQKAREAGFAQVIWTDASEHEYIEESGTMNLMFVIGGRLVTPPLSDSILDGITRDSLLQLATDMDIEVEERPVSVKELVHGIEREMVTEAFGAGTAAVVAPISAIGVDGLVYQLPDYNGNSVMFRLKNELEQIRTGRVADRYGWNSLVTRQAFIFSTPDPAG